MLDTPRPRRVYRVHREKQQRHILTVARALFEQRGIDNVTMVDICTASDLMASTVYQYFANKEDIVWAIVYDILVESHADFQRILQASHASAFNKMQSLLKSMADELCQRPARARFMAQFDVLYARESNAKRLMDIEAVIYTEPVAVLLTRLAEAGIADGSLRADINPHLSLHSAINAALSMQRRLVMIGGHLEQEFDQTAVQLFQETCRLLLEGLRASTYPASC